jgi:BTB/POZ domain-containing protein KCTD9
MRLPYEKSFARLREVVDIMGEPRPAVTEPPRYDDAEMGPTVFRMLVEDVSLENLTVPGLFVGRSELLRVSFRGTDLRLSTLNWSNFLDCDFREVDFSGADLRACIFVRCSFARANLEDTDLRVSTFEGCSFDGAIVRGMKLCSLSDQKRLLLSREQQSEVNWLVDAPEPGGG